MINQHDRRTTFGIALLTCVLSFSVWTTAAAQERMTPIPADKMTDAQKKAAADFTAARGNLSGPWAVLLRSPELVNRVRPLSDYLRFNSTLSPRLSEFVILITAREWGQQYEWNAHYPLALKGGLNPDVAKAVAEGRRPAKMAEDEEIAYDFCTELDSNHSVSDATYARAVAKFGEQGVVEMVSLHGYYTLIAMVLNTARTPLPPGATSGLARLPR
jgi:4-carboxymuconolactone decarboxylase